MEAALVVITLISLATAAAAVATACRVVRRERRRSAARVAALAGALSERSEARSDRAGDVSDAWRPGSRRRHSNGRECSPADLEHDRPEGGALFEIAQRPGDDPRRVGLALAAGALIVAVAAGSAIAIGRSSANGEAAVRPAIETSAAADPLELVALRHERDAGTLTIAGIVRNPATAGRITGLSAAVALLDRSGSLISRHDVPLDCRNLAPGEESPFRVTLPDAGTIGRYRVSFRANGGAAPHVDRRGHMAMATRTF